MMVREIKFLQLLVSFIFYGVLPGNTRLSGCLELPGKLFCSCGRTNTMVESYRLAVINIQLHSTSNGILLALIHRSIDLKMSDILLMYDVFTAMVKLPGR